MCAKHHVSEQTRLITANLLGVLITALQKLPCYMYAVSPHLKMEAGVL